MDALGLVWLTWSHSVAGADEARGGMVAPVALWVINESMN